MCCITIDPGGRLHREEENAWKRISAKTAQEATQLELALASMIREEDIAQLTGSFNQKLLEYNRDLPKKPSGAGEAVSMDESSLLLLSHDFWLFILTGENKDQAFSGTRQVWPPDQLDYWLELFSTTIEEHFCGTMGHVARGKVVQYLDSFLYRLLLLQH